MSNSHVRVNKLHSHKTHPNLLNLKQLKFNWKPVTVIFISTMILIYDHYRNIVKNNTLESFVLYLALPLLIILVVFRESPKEYGLRLGDWKIGLVLTVVGILGVSLIMPFVARSSTFSDYYATISDRFLPLLGRHTIEYFCWEFFFRGFLFFALMRIVGPYAIFLQAVPFTMAHLSKPEVETLSCMFGGSLFGYVAWRTNSLLYCFIIHTYLSVFTVLLC